MANSQQALSQLCDRCKRWCSSPFPMALSQQCTADACLPYGIMQYYLPPNTGKSVLAIHAVGGQASTNLYCLVNRGTCV